MKRCLFAIVAAAASMAAVAAQPPAIPAPVPPIPPARWHFHPTPGLFYYDSGDYLLGGFQGLSRSRGMWTIQPAAGAADGSGFDAGGAAVAGSCAACGRHFRR
jgi:hypothetical protein